MRKRVLIAGVVLLALICSGLYFSGNIGIAEDKINDVQRNTVSWDEADYNIIATCSDGGSLYVGVIYMKDYSDAKYFIYIKKGGLSFGWHFLQGGGLSKADGVRAFDCGEYGTAYVALNENNSVWKIEFEDGRKPAISENVGRIICEQSQSVIRFYDIYGNIVEPTKLTLKD